MTATASGIERALIGTDARGGLIVLATDGPWITNDCEEVCANAEDIGLVDEKDCPEPGLYLWEGKGRVVVHGAPWDAPEPTVEYEGTVRKVRPDEVESLYAMTAPEGEQGVDDAGA